MSYIWKVSWVLTKRQGRIISADTLSHQRQNLPLDLSLRQHIAIPASGQRLSPSCECYSDRRGPQNRHKLSHYWTCVPNIHNVTLRCSVPGFWSPSSSQSPLHWSMDQGRTVTEAIQILLGSFGKFVCSDNDTVYLSGHWAFWGSSMVVKFWPCKERGWVHCLGGSVSAISQLFLRNQAN